MEYKSWEVITPEGTNEINFNLEKLLITVDDSGRHKGLLKAIANPLILMGSFERIIRNSGYYSKGVDNEILTKVDRMFFTNLSREIGSGMYKPKPSRRIYIPKKDGSKRPLGISCSVDKIVQEAMRKILELIYEPKFISCSHGFRPYKSCYTALNDYKMQFGSVSWIINLDIKKCFDNIDHHRLAKILKQNIEDRGFMDLYWKMVKAGYVFNGTCFKEKKGTPQGSIVSPILANIYLHQLDLYMIKLKTEYDWGIWKRHNPAYRRKDKIIKTLRKLKIFRTMIADKNFRRLQYVRYADDFIIGLDGDKLSALEIAQKASIFIKEYLKMEIKNNEVIGFKHKQTTFLGYIIRGCPLSNRSVKINSKGIYSTINPRPKILFPMKRALMRLMEKGFVKRLKGNNFKGTALRKLIHHPLYNIIEYYNSVYRGIANYYKICSFRAPLRNIHYILKSSCALTIALKMKLRTMHKTLKVYGRFLTIKENNSKISFIKWDCWKKDKVIQNVYDPLEEIRKFTSFTMRSKLINNEGCEVCGSYEDLQLHHINPRRNIKSERNSLNYIKSAVIRKQKLLCRNCHSTIHRKR